ncbi:MAG TPA: hypothetical protein VGR43_00485, partial [Dehalococcoidia bacterium]|nr:hypothetical protein [Dehalococcoidia bacterium]
MAPTTMPHFLQRYRTAIPLLALIVIASVIGALKPGQVHGDPEPPEGKPGAAEWEPGPVQARFEQCPATGSPFGPFDMQAYEAANYRTSYPRTMDLAAFNQLFPDRPSFALQGIEGVNGSPYIPPVILKAIAWIESGWAQGAYDPPVQYGQVGPTLISNDCGYGIMQITSGMQNVSGVPNLDQAMIGGHYAFNIARGARILADKWNLAPEYRPVVGSRNSTIIEDWYYALWGYNGFASKNHPLSHNPNRPPYLCDGTQPRGNYPYQELVFGCVAHPPVRGGSPLWAAQPVTLPNPADPAFAGLASWDPFNACVYNAQCGGMNIPTPNAWHQDPTGPSFNRSQVIGDPSIAVSTGSISLVAPAGGKSPSREVAIGNAGSGVLAWRVTGSAPWLRLSRVQGVSLGADLGYQHQVFSLHADASQVYPGNHTAQIIVESLYAAAAPTVITVTLETADGALVSAPDGHVYVLVEGLRRYIPDGATLEGLDYKWSDIIQVPTDWLNPIPIGDSVPSTLADGRLISSGNFVYVMQGGAKRWITSGSAMAACG